MRKFLHIRLHFKLFPSLRQGFLCADFIYVRFHHSLYKATHTALAFTRDKIYWPFFCEHKFLFLVTTQREGKKNLEKLFSYLTFSYINSRCKHIFYISPFLAIPQYMSMYGHKKPKYIPSGQHVDKRYFLMNKKFPTKLRNEKKRGTRDWI